MLRHCGGDRVARFVFPKDPSGYRMDTDHFGGPCGNHMCCESLGPNSCFQACGYPVSSARSALPCSADGYPLLIFLFPALMAHPSRSLPDPTHPSRVSHFPWLPTAHWDSLTTDHSGLRFPIMALTTLGHHCLVTGPLTGLETLKR